MGKKILKMRLKVILIFAVILGMALAGITWLLISHQKVVLGSRYIYTEKSGFCYTLNNAEKTEISDYLSHTYHESAVNAGFGIRRQSQPDIFRQLYFNYRVAIQCGLDVNSTYALLFDDVFTSYENLLNVWELPGYELFYYDCLRAQRGQILDEQTIGDQLKAATDPATGLLFYRHKDDDLGTKLLLTSKVLRLADIHRINIHRLKYNEAIAQCFEDYPFESPQSGKSFFNAGGSLLYAAGSVSDFASEKITSCQDWFKQWSDVYAVRQISDLPTLIDVSSYAAVANIFDETPTEQLNQYLSNLQISDFASEQSQKLECEIICDYILARGVDLIDPALIDYLEQITLAEMQQLDARLSSCGDINLGDTYYGAQLAYLSGFQWDQTKTTQTVCQFYQEMQNQLSDRDLIFNTYYYVLYLDSFGRDIMTDHERESITRRLDDIIERLLHNLEQVDVNELRVALEIKSGLDSYVRRSHLEKIKTLLRSYAENPVGHVKAIDIFKIDKIVNLNILTDKLFRQLEQALSMNGGYAAAVGDEADLTTTFRIYSMTCNHDLFKPDKAQVAAMKKFLNQLLSDGLYRYRSGNALSDYRSILYGYMLRDFNGEQKND